MEDGEKTHRSAKLKLWNVDAICHLTEFQGDIFELTFSVSPTSLLPIELQKNIVRASRFQAFQEPFQSVKPAVSTNHFTMSNGSPSMDCWNECPCG